MAKLTILDVHEGHDEDLKMDVIGNLSKHEVAVIDAGSGALATRLKNAGKQGALPGNLNNVKLYSPSPLLSDHEMISYLYTWINEADKHVPTLVIDFGKFLRQFSDVEFSDSFSRQTITETSSIRAVTTRIIKMLIESTAFIRAVIFNRVADEPSPPYPANIEVLERDHAVDRQLISSFVKGL